MAALLTVRLSKMTDIAAAQHSLDAFIGQSGLGFRELRIRC